LSFRAPGEREESAVLAAISKNLNSQVLISAAKERATMSYPSDRKYTKEHEWIKVEGDTGTIGITDYAQNTLGDIVFVELPKVGAKLEMGKSLGTVESVKAVSDVFSPASGTVTAVNEELTKGPEKLNSDAHAAWLVKLKMDGALASDLLSANEYEAYLKEEAAK
jgi:glycine cleavage system H protein